MNSWDNVQLGSDLPVFQGGRFAVYRAQFTPHAAAQKSGGRLVLRDVVGRALGYGLTASWLAEKVDLPRKTGHDNRIPRQETGERVVSVLD